MRRVALVAPDLEGSGGVASLVAFLLRTLRGSSSWEPALVTLALSSRDRASVRLLDPRTWLRGIEVRGGTWRGVPRRHVGAFLAELEFQRYRPRAALDRILAGHDLVQVVSGTPAWAAVARRADAPVALMTATMAEEERRARLEDESGAAGAWRRLMTRATARLDRRALEGLDLAFAINPAMRERMAARLGEERVVLAPPGVDTDLFHPAPERGTGPDEGTGERAGPRREGRAGAGREERAGGAPGHLLSVGRFADPRKNVALLFRAYALLAGRMASPPPLLLAGRSGPGPEDRALARSLGIADRVRFVESPPAEELARLYREASVFVLSSRQEGLGIVILEAMASGLPVVSTDCGGPASTVAEGETGYLVPTDDAEALAGRLETLLGNPSLAERMGREARRAALSRFSLRACGRRVLERYAALAGGPSPRT